MRASLVISALVAVLVGFGGSVAVVLAAAQAVGADAAQTSSWIAALCLAMVASTAILSIRHRLPIVTAWSTPGAALIATTDGIAFEEAVGAFVLAAVLMLATAIYRPLAQAIERIPGAIASAMLAGVLFGFVTAIFEHASALPALVLPMLAVFVIVRLFSPAWAVLATLALAITLAYALGLAGPLPAPQLSTFVLTVPSFEPAVLLGLGLPLYLVTMASQNLPGFAVLRAADYPVPARPILGVTGLVSLLTAPAGAHATNLAAITASICTGPDCHPDPAERWRAGPFYAAGYGVLALFGASLVALFGSFPLALIVTIAGIALAGPMMGALAIGLAGERDRFAAIATFVVTASGLEAFGIGAAFWGLLAGLALASLERLYAHFRGAA